MTKSNTSTNFHGTLYRWVFSVQMSFTRCHKTNDYISPMEREYVNWERCKKLSFGLVIIFSYMKLTMYSTIQNVSRFDAVNTCVTRYALAKHKTKHKNSDSACEIPILKTHTLYFFLHLAHILRPYLRKPGVRLRRYSTFSWPMSQKNGGFQWFCVYNIWVLQQVLSEECFFQFFLR